MKSCVLTYHAINILGNDYDNNDHVALAEDLRLIEGLGVQIVSLDEVLSRVFEPSTPAPGRPFIALSFDDGAMFDWRDFDHPTCGPQRSFANIIADHCAASGASTQHHPATSFVIVSPGARRQLDEICFGGRGWWEEDWWQAATDSGRLSIQNHSWDHNHEVLPKTVQTRGEKGNFRCIDSYRDADAQIRQASDYLDRRISGQRTRYFAYPYGQTNDYLIREYLPGFAAEHRLGAAFTTEPGYLSRASDRWTLPRFVCGLHWKQPAELEQILKPLI